MNENLLASSDGHVWAVIELDRTAHLNDAKITLHTQWQGLRYYMHKFRLLLFIIGPFFIWGFEVFSLTLAAYLVISIFGSSSDSGNNNNKSDSTSSIGNRLPLRDATPSTHSSQRQRDRQQVLVQVQQARALVAQLYRKRNFLNLVVLLQVVLHLQYR